ncbi:hypothetical protein G9A89_018146 [Geosiphon pyriformis]|nr:hypothetical protein G9A89_018146 [Geosiphon pyriformis]
MTHVRGRPKPFRYCKRQRSDPYPSPAPKNKPNGFLSVKVAKKAGVIDRIEDKTTKQKLIDLFEEHDGCINLGEVPALYLASNNRALEYTGKLSYALVNELPGVLKIINIAGQQVVRLAEPFFQKHDVTLKLPRSVIAAIATHNEELDFRNERFDEELTGGNSFSRNVLVSETRIELDEPNFTFDSNGQKTSSPQKTGKACLFLDSDDDDDDDDNNKKEEQDEVKKKARIKIQEMKPLEQNPLDRLTSLQREILYYLFKINPVHKTLIFDRVNRRNLS